MFTLELFTFQDGRMHREDEELQRLMGDDYGKPHSQRKMEMFLGSNFRAYELTGSNPRFECLHPDMLPALVADLDEHGATVIWQVREFIPVIGVD